VTQTGLNRNIVKRRAAQSGSALVYILIAIALLAALTYSFMGSSSQQTSSQNTFKSLSSLQGQVDVIRSAIQECILLYPNGDNAITDAGADKKFPINPDSTYYATATPGRSGDRLVKNIRCPGHPTTGNAYDHALLFSGTSGKFLPPPPDLFLDWQFYNGTDGVFYWIRTDKSDAYLTAALQKLDEKFSTCEADVIDASAAAVDLDSGPDVECPVGNTCFRVWMKANATAVHQDAGCP